MDSGDKPTQLRDLAAALRKAEEVDDKLRALRNLEGALLAAPDELKHYAGELTHILQQRLQRHHAHSCGLATAIMLLMVMLKWQHCVVHSEVSTVTCWYSTVSAQYVYETRAVSVTYPGCFTAEGGSS